MRTAVISLALLAAVVTAGCGGGGSGSASPPNAVTPPVGNGTTTTASSASENAVAATNAVGDPMNNLNTNNAATTSLQSAGRGTLAVQLGVCQTNAAGGSHEFFAPDTNGDANSNEQRYFYDSSCTQLARDIVRISTSTGASSETVSSTTKIFAQGSSTPSATRTNAIVLTNATFDPYGFPRPADGFDRVDTGALNVAGANTTDSGAELVMSAGSGSQNYCSDSAAYNATGIPSLNETFGSQGGVLSTGTRTVNGDGSVTWTSTHTGFGVKGTLGALSLAIGTQNTACPIVTPMFAIAGGTALGSYSIPIVATYKGDILTNLTITNATLPSGNALNVTTNGGVPATSMQFLSGAISNGGKQIATFNVDAFGDGTLTLASNGAQFVITDWHVVK